MEPTPKIIQDGITFDDVLLVPSYSEITPELADTRTALTRNISLNIPLISAPMDTVTLSSLAIALAQEGGIGIIHKNLPAERQAREVARVKRSENGVIADPVTLSPEDSVERAMIQMSEQGVSGFPVTTDGTSRGRVVGILTRRDMTFLHADDSTARVGDVMTRENLITAPADVKSERAEELMTRSRVEKLLLLDGTGSLAGLMTMRDLENVRNHPQACRDERGRLRVGAAIGPHQFERAHALIEAEVDVLVVDTAHGHSKNVIDTVRRLKSECSIDVIAGNVATGDGARALIDAGADGVKIGIGPGSICTTRVVTGVGVPQITAIMNAVEVASSEQVPIIADGGIRMSGDIAKAIASGASSVMLGSLFAGPGRESRRVDPPSRSPIQELPRHGFKRCHGRRQCRPLRAGRGARHHQVRPEGVEGMVPYRGALSDVVYQMVGGIRSAMGYCGCTDMEAFRANARFVRVTAASMVESHPHDITITKEAPNYSASNATGGGFES